MGFYSRFTEPARAGRKVTRVEFLTPEAELPQVVSCRQSDGRLKLEVPSFLVYGVLRVYLDESTQPEPPVRRRIAAIVTEYGFRLSDTIADALTLGTDALAVDGVLLIAEHGNYPHSPTSNIQYPKRRFWEETLAVFRKSGRVVPVFIDKHLSDNWADARFIYDTAQEMKIPLMAGSSLPVTWRRPAADVRPGAKLKEIVATTPATAFFVSSVMTRSCEVKLSENHLSHANPFIQENVTSRKPVQPSPISD